MMDKLKLKILDYYIIRKFLGTFFFSIMLIVTIAVILDSSEKLADILAKRAPRNAIIIDYYLNFIPYLASLFSPLFIFISVIYFTSKMASDTEIIAILSSGVSFLRLMYPYFIGALLLTVFFFVLNDAIIPHANLVRYEFEDQYLKKKKVTSRANVHKQVEPGLFVYMQSFNSDNNVGRNFTLERIEDGRLVSKLSADVVRWDSIRQIWTVSNYRVRNIDGLREQIYTGRRLDTTLNMDPAEFRRRDDFEQTMGVLELNRYINHLQMQGADNINYYRNALHKRVATPFSAFILTLIGVTLSSRKVRGGIGLHIAIGIVLSFSYILFLQFSSQFAAKGTLSPLVAAWIPNVLFFSIGIYLYYKAPK
jgi:lipopolysaccharide export system permease protein